MTGVSELTLTLSQPAQLGDRARKDFVLSTMEHVPGSVVRGAFAAAWLARHGVVQAAHSGAQAVPRPVRGRRPVRGAAARRHRVHVAGGRRPQVRPHRRLRDRRLRPRDERRGPARLLPGLRFPDRAAPRPARQPARPGPPHQRRDRRVRHRRSRAAVHQGTPPRRARRSAAPSPPPRTSGRSWRNSDRSGSAAAAPPTASPRSPSARAERRRPRSAAPTATSSSGSGPRASSPTTTAAPPASRPRTSSSARSASPPASSSELDPLGTVGRLARRLRPAQAPGADRRCRLHLP